MQTPDHDEILERLKLIDRMMAEGRETTQRWGWSLLLWGIGPLVAMLWAARGPYPNWAWPVTLGVCAIVNGLVVRARKRHGLPETTIMRAVGSVWVCVGFTVLLLACGSIWAGVPDVHLLYAALFALAGVAHGAGSLILKWRPQFVVALMWWGASVAAFALPADRLQALAAGALLLGNVAFGAWLSYREWSGARG